MKFVWFGVFDFSIETELLLELGNVVEGGLEGEEPECMVGDGFEWAKKKREERNEKRMWLWF